MKRSTRFIVVKGTLRLGALLAAGCATTSHAADPVDVAVNLNVRREVGGVSTFDRSKFITIHANHTDSEWNGGQQGGNNFTNNLLGAFTEGYDVYFGRDTGYITWQLKANINEDPAKPGWAKVTGGNYSIATEGAQARSSYDSKTAVHPYAYRSRENVIAAQFLPFWPDGEARCGRTGSKWMISTNDTPAEPFGSATGNYMGHFLNHFYEGPSQSGRPLPLWVEVLNEPDWPLFEWSGDPLYGTSSPEELWTLHNSVANQIHALNTNVMVGGYCPAFPDLERDGFEEWTQEWETFIDQCGSNMDFYAIHLYDIDSSTKYLIRRGGFTEAVFDMIEHYSQIKLGKQLPFVVSEYAGKDTALQQQGWSAYYDWIRIKSMSGYLLSFMDRPDLIGKTIPFIMLKAEWGRNGTTGIPYGARLLRQEDEAIDPTNTTGDWVYTEQVKFYQLWSDVNGTRVDSDSADADIQIDAFVDGDKAYVILNNLDTAPRSVDLGLVENPGGTIQSVREKNLYWNGTSVVLDDIVHAGALAQVQLGAEGTAILEYTFAAPVVVDQTSEEVKYYATSYFQPITQDVAQVFSITNVTKGAYGEAVLRLGAGRSKTLSKRPTVLFNGVPLIVPTNFMGHEGDDREVFFAVLEIPVPYALLQPSNTVSVTYPDSGGHVSSVALRAFEFSADLRELSYDIDIDSVDMMGTNLVLGFSAGPTNGYFSVLTKTNLMAAGWMLDQTELAVDDAGDGAVTNAMEPATAFYKLVRSDTPQPPPVGPPPAPVVIEFTAPDYADAALSGQQGWLAEAGWSVGDSAGAGYATTAANSDIALLNEPVALRVGETYALSVMFSFGGTYAQPTNYVYAFLGGLKADNTVAHMTTGGTAADANIQLLANSDNYRLLDNWSPVGDQITTAPLDAGDVLQFDYELTMGADAASTSYTVRLQNRTDGTDTGIGGINGIDASVYAALSGSGAYGFFQTISPGSNGSGLSGLWVDSVTTTNPSE